ncbi:unnamed protein product, partial [marine sediment metagenome]
QLSLVLFGFVVELNIFCKGQSGVFSLIMDNHRNHRDFVPENTKQTLSKLLVLS